ncbi:hypothetical protein SAMN06296378_2932 [Salinibacterium xinjiangense]|uniref:Uncharacterized protein n=1 Tax=Salinibacterium xinjiangense TaxID=386302 RepID=A0A2C9A3S4_9MICO|nr:hypothetical protein SAMN06296378_2932 [Salinibacterium xinjiangense]
MPPFCRRRHRSMRRVFEHVVPLVLLGWDVPEVAVESGLRAPIPLHNHGRRLVELPQNLAVLPRRSDHPGRRKTDPPMAPQVTGQPATPNSRPREPSATTVVDNQHHRRYHLPAPREAPARRKAGLLGFNGPIRNHTARNRSRGKKKNRTDSSVKTNRSCSRYFMTRLLELHELPNVGGSENTKALIRRFEILCRQKAFHGETPKIPVRPHPNEFGVMKHD